MRKQEDNEGDKPVRPASTLERPLDKDWIMPHNRVHKSPSRHGGTLRRSVTGVTGVWSRRLSKTNSTSSRVTMRASSELTSTSTSCFASFGHHRLTGGKEVPLGKETRARETLRAGPNHRCSTVATRLPDGFRMCTALCGLPLLLCVERTLGANRQRGESTTTGMTKMIARLMKYGSPLTITWIAADVTAVKLV